METPEQDQTPFVMPASARIGSLIGMTLWTPGPGIGLALAGSPLLGLEVSVTLLAMSLALWALGTRMLDEVDARRGSTKERLVVLWGFLLFSIGTLFLAVHGAAARAAVDEAVLSSNLGFGDLETLPSVRFASLLILVGAGLLCTRRGSFPRRTPSPRGPSSEGSNAADRGA